MGDSFLWIGPISGDWGAASNWKDQTTGLAATMAPGSLDTANVSNSLVQFQTIAGPGSAASLFLGGNNALTGLISAGTLSAGAGELDIGTGATVMAGGALLYAVPAIGQFAPADVTVNGSGAALTVTGMLALGVIDGNGRGSDLIASNGGAVSAGALLMADDQSTIQVDSASTIEIGTGGSAAAGSLTVDAGATLTVGHTSNADIVANTIDNGTIAVAATSAIDLQGTLSGSGQVSVGDAGFVESAAIAAGGPTITLGSNVEALMDGAVGAGSTIAMAGTSDVLSLRNLAAFAGTVTGFDQTDSLVVNGTITSAVYTAGTGATGTLALFDAATQVGSVTLIGDYTGVMFQPAPTGNPATTEIVVGGTAPCFAKGTRIATDRGEVPVESLRVGDRVRTVLDDDMQEIVWIGHRRADCTRHPKPKAIWPVRISAGAFGAGRPSRDLFLSPDHSVYANEVLIPVKRLINGTTIVQVPVDEVAYFHVLLPRHEVLLADGLTVESYLDTGDRADFANGGVSIALHPELAARFWEAMGCAPLMVVGPEVTAVKRLLAARARQIARAARLPGRQHGKRNGATAVARRAGGLAA
jgi:hypothetical protein